MAENIHRLEGTEPGVGGLIIRKKKIDEDASSSKFKLPHLEKRSLLGLDKLAAIKEKERKDSDQKKELDRFKVKSKSSDADRKYRRPQEETPTYTGGVNPEAKRRKEERKDKERDRGFYVSNKDRDDRRKDRRGERRGDHRKDGRHSDYSERRHDRSERRRDWEVETPRSNRHVDDDIETPYLKAKSTPSSTNWEDEDHRTPGKLSSWDLPTPGSSRREDDSERSSSSHKRSSRPHYDKETPLPTPSYKKNPWHNRRSNKENKSSRSNRTPDTAKDVDRYVLFQKNVKNSNFWFIIGIFENYYSIIDENTTHIAASFIV